MKGSRWQGHKRQGGTGPLQFSWDNQRLHRHNPANTDFTIMAPAFSKDWIKFIWLTHGLTQYRCVSGSLILNSSTDHLRRFAEFLLCPVSCCHQKMGAAAHNPRLSMAEYMDALSFCQGEHVPLADLVSCHCYPQLVFSRSSYHGSPR